MIDHRAPMKSTDDTCICNVEDFYPDLYERGGQEYIGSPEDREGLSIILRVHNKPNRSVKIYRAVPDINKKTKDQLKTIYNAIYFLEQLKKRNFTKRTKEVEKLIWDLTEKYSTEKYDYDTEQDVMIKDLREQADQLESTLEKEIKIERGNWVTPSKQYAKEHGRSNIKGPFKIIQKTVKAKDLFTDGNSLSEWGYDPQ